MRAVRFFPAVTSQAFKSQRRSTASGQRMVRSEQTIGPSPAEKPNVSIIAAISAQFAPFHSAEPPVPFGDCLTSTIIRLAHGSWSLQRFTPAGVAALFLPLSEPTVESPGVQTTSWLAPLPGHCERVVRVPKGLASKDLT